MAFMKPGVPTIHFRWLLEASAESQDVLYGDGDLEQQPLRIDPELGHGHFDLFNLALGLCFYRSTHRWLPAAAGQLIPLGELDIDYGGPSFTVQTLRGGRLCQREFLPEADLIVEDGRDFFSHTARRHLIPLVDGSSDSVMAALSMRMTTLQAILGEEEAAVILKALGLSLCPSLAVRPMPKHLGALLHSAMSAPLTGSARRLFAQAKALEYLSGLAGYLQLDSPTPAHAPQARPKVQALHAFLLGLEGKAPNLETLAHQFELPARRLNTEFSREYGESIHAFIAGHRLDQARVVLLETGLPMKELASRLGFSHVNNFINAFKNRFGFSPGSLRRKALQHVDLPTGEP